MQIHPLVAGAAVSVMLLSGVGIASITGLLPGSGASAKRGAAPASAAAPQTPSCGNGKLTAA